MNNFFTQLKNSARTTKLAQSEKQAMRMRLYTYLENNPVAATAAPAPKITKPVPSMYYFFSPQYMVPVALLLVIGLSGGTAFAAQSALPGEPLYAIKINVNEAVQTALATSPESKAQVNAQLATTRLEEAETLASQGTLDATTTAELAANFTAHAQAAQAGTQTLASNDPGTAAQLDTDFNSTLAAHGAILAQIGDDSKSDETMQNSNVLAMQVRQEAERGNQDNGSNSDNGLSLAIATDTNAPAPAATATPQNDARIRTFAAVAPQTSATGSASSSATSTPVPHPTSGITLSKTSGSANDPKVAASLSAQASTSLAAAQQDFAVLKKSLDGSTSAQISAQLAILQTNYASAAAELAAGNASAAVQDFTSVIRASVKLDAYLKAGEKFNIHLLSGLLGNSDNNNSQGGNDSGKMPTIIPATSAATTTDNASGDNGQDTQDNQGKGSDGFHSNLH